VGGNAGIVMLIKSLTIPLGRTDEIGDTHMLGRGLDPGGKVSTTRGMVDGVWGREDGAVCGRNGARVFHAVIGARA
jgi:hypothetical protein